MQQMYTVVVELEKLRVSPHTLGLLIPVAPDLDVQTCTGLRFIGQEHAKKVWDTTGTQQAWFLPSEWVRQLSTIEYDFTLPTLLSKQSDAHFQVGEIEPWENALGYNMASLGISEQQLCCEETTIAKIVQYIGHKFQYISQPSTGELGNLTCDLLTGNCIDINQSLMALLSAAGIEHCYLSGVYSAQPQGLASHGWHCWVAIRHANSTQYWDIAQHLKSGTTDIRPSLNPVGGVRFALAQGTNLQFLINHMCFSIPKLPLPTFIFNDGSSELLIPDVTINNRTH
jgi:hypothetical protein